MGAEDEGLTLRGLARRLEALERENAALRRKATTLEGCSGTHLGEGPALGSEAQVSRRWLLSKAGAAAAGTVAAGALMLRDTREADANHYGADIQANSVTTHSVSADNEVSAGVALRGRTVSSGHAVEAINASATGVGLHAEGGETGVEGKGSVGVVGVGNPFLSSVGVRGSGGVFGVHGRFGLLAGVVGDGMNSTSPGGIISTSPGVLGRGTDDGIGVQGEGKNGVLGKSSAPDGQGVLGRNDSKNGRGVTGDSAQGTGVWGESTGGYGGHFNGGKAPLRLVPGGTAGRPTTGDHTKGELYMDSAATLFVCVADGNPGSWRRVTTTPTS
jgi:hypothetical protein